MRRIHLYQYINTPGGFLYHWAHNKVVVSELYERKNKQRIGLYKDTYSANKFPFHQHKCILLIF
jgi:hypothetical protein